MCSVSKRKFKAQSLQTHRELEPGGEGALLPVPNHPIASLHTSDAGRPVEQVFQEWRGKLVFYEDPNSPSIEEWSDA